MAKLNNKEINEIVRAAYQAAAPDKINSIIGAAKKNNRVPTFMISQKDYRYFYTKRIGAAAAALIIIAGFIFALTAFHTSRPYATITMENDECVEITLNSDFRPLGITGRSSAAIRLARRIDVGNDIGDTIDSTLDAMIDGGNLSEDSNTVLITVDAPENDKQLLDLAFDAAIDSFRERDFNCAILTTVATDDKAVARIARRNRVSVGKAEMVRDIIRADSSLTTDTLCRLSVNDLNALSSFKGIRYADIDVFGESRGLIPPQTAVEYVTADIGDMAATATVTIEVDAGRLVYRVTVRSGDQVYTYRLSAQNGEILAVTQDGDPQTAPMAVDDPAASSPTEKRPAPTEKTTNPSGGTVTVITSESGGSSSNNPTVNIAPQATEKQTDAPAATESAKVSPTSKPTLATDAPPSTQAPQKAEPQAFTSGSYIQSGGVQSKQPSASKQQIGIARILNGYDLFYNASTFPYTASGQQGSISALVCNTEQLRRLIGGSDSRFDSDYFESHVLYIYMNRDVSYHWIKSVTAAYTDGETLYLENSDPVGYYITSESGNSERIYTVVYELNKSDLPNFVNLLEYTE